MNTTENKISMMIGKTIVAVQRMKLKHTDDEGYLLLTFSDQSCVLLVASYGWHTGHSEDEYPTFIYIDTDVNKNLARLEEIYDCVASAEK